MLNAIAFVQVYSVEIVCDAAVFRSSRTTFLKFSLAYKTCSTEINRGDLNVRNLQPILTKP